MYVHIIGTVSTDGNCLFRALANAITRSQTQHDVLCMYIARYMAEPVAALSNELYKILGIHRLHTTDRKASTNGCGEHLHRTLNGIIAKTVNEYHTDWSTLLSYCAFSYNTSVHSVTGFSPF